MFKNSLKIIFAVFFLIASLYLLVTNFAHAQQTALDLTAYPSTFVINAKPGVTLSERFRLRNNSSSPLTLSISLKKLTPDTSGNITIKDFTSSDTYQNWISFDKTSVVTQPTEWTDVNFKIKIPQDTAFGYYFVLYIAPKEEATQQNSPHATINGSLAIPILLTVDKPGATIAGRMLSFTASTYFSEYLPLDFLTTFINTGNLFTRPNGTIFIKDWTGNTIDTLSINSAGAAVLPGGKRIYTTSWDNSFITSEPVVKDDVIQRDSNGNPKTHLVFHFDRVLNFRIGKYTALALTVIPTASHDVSFTSTLSFWVFPWKIILILIVVLILVAIGFFSTLRSGFKAIRKIFKK